MPFLRYRAGRRRACLLPVSRRPLEVVELSWLGSPTLLLVLLALVSVRVTPTYAGFITALSYPVASQSGISSFMAVGDFNRDGNLDVIVTTAEPYPNNGSMAILLGKSDGSFQAAQSYALDFSPGFVAVGDFNGDGIPDLAMLSHNVGGVIILLGNGDGTFQAPQSFVAGLSPGSVVIGDFNGDGFLDLAVPNNPGHAGTPAMVSILLGNGDGTFQALQQYALTTDTLVEVLTVADFNHDGHLDLAVSQAGAGVAVLLGNGDGTFQPAQAYPTGGTQTFGLAAGDFNGDGNPDLVASDYLGNAGLSVLLGNGDGTFQPPQSFALPPEGGGGITVGDFNGDGHLDVAVTGYWGVGILLGNGDGTFQTAQFYSPVSSSVIVSDFNRDGVPDLALFTGATVSILLGKGDGSFRGARTYPPGYMVAVADFNGDGVLDLVTVEEFLENGTILLGQGDGTFQAAATIPAGDPAVASLAVGDFNGDGKPDSVMTTYIIEENIRLRFFRVIESGVRVFLGNGDGTFQDPHYYPTEGAPNSVAVADLNGDGIGDLIVANGGDSNFGGNNTVSVLLGNGDGTFKTAQTYAAGRNAESVAVGDFNGDGHTDIVVVNYSAGTVSVLLGNGDGTFQQVQSYAAGSNPVSVAVADFNGDGLSDLAVANQGISNAYADGSVEILLSKGDGTFQPAQSYAVANGPTYLAVADFNRDGYLDLAVHNTASDTVSILLGHGDGSFQPPLDYSDAPGGILAVGDFNRDGWPDLAAGVTVLLNAADWR